MELPGIDRKPYTLDNAKRKISTPEWMG